MLLASKLPVQVWPEAVCTAVFLTNYSPSSVNLGDCTPPRSLYSALQLPYTFNLKHLYGVTTYVHIVPEKRKKGDKFVAWARKGFLIGYGEEELAADIEAVPSSGLIRQVFNSPSLSPPIGPRRSDRSTKGIPPTRFEDAVASVPPDLRNLLLSQAPPTLLYTFSAGLEHSAVVDDIPNTHRAAMLHPDAEKWRTAEQLELQQLQRLHVAELVPLPKRAKLLPSKWYTHRNVTWGLGPMPHQNSPTSLSRPPVTTKFWKPHQKHDTGHVILKPMT
ncbi:unnamed protein product [Calypogeia fissa]